MPELPEVETVRRDMEREIVNKKITSVALYGNRTVRRQPAEQFIDAVARHSVNAVRRRGKFLMVDLDGSLTMFMHLRMSGQLLWTGDPEAPLKKHTHARLGFDDGPELRFVDPRTFGELWVGKSGGAELGHMGPDALDALVSADQLEERFAKRRSGVKSLLVNQQVIAGVGNIYSDEILHRARLRQGRTPQSLTKPALQRLFVATRDVLSEAVELRGSSLADSQYVDLYGQGGKAQVNHRVYGRQGLPCLECTTPIQRLKLGGRGSFFCPRCQK